MFTKTGLRPREIQPRRSATTTSKNINNNNNNNNNNNSGSSFAGLEPRSGAAQHRLPPIAAAAAVDDFHAGCSSVTAMARMLRARRQAPLTAGMSAAVAARCGGAAVSVTKESGVGGGRQGRPTPARATTEAWEICSSPAKRKELGGRGRADSGGGGGAAGSRNSKRGVRDTSGRRGRGGRGGDRSRSRSVGGRARREASATVMRGDRRPTRKRPEWDDSLTDTSQYRLTPEEAVRRKIALISKHNTLIFGPGGGGGSKTDEVAVSPPSAVAAAAAAAARRRSAKRVEQERLRASPGASSFSVPASVVPAIYGGAGGGVGCRRKHGAGLDCAPVLGADSALLSSDGGGGGGSGGLAFADEVNDLTITLHPRRTPARGDGEIDNGDQGGDDSRSRGRRRSVSSIRGGKGDDGHEVELRVAGSGISARSKRASGDTSGLAEIEVGIMEFSKRVGRLESYGKAGVAEKELAIEVSAGGSDDNYRGGGASEIEDLDWNQAQCCSCSSSNSSSTRQPDGGSLTQTAMQAGVASSGVLECQSPSLTIAADEEEIVNHQHSAVTEVHLGHHQSRSANPWCDGTPSPLSSLREKLLLREAAAAVGPVTSARPCPTSGGGSSGSSVSSGEAGLVKRIELLEAQILRLGSPASFPVAITSSAPRAGNADLDQETICRDDHGVRTAALRAAGRQAAREEELRVILVDLLSLSAVLLTRAITAERRLRDSCLGGKRDGGGGDDTGAGDGDDVYERASLVKASAEAFVAGASTYGSAASRLAFLGKEGIDASTAATGAAGGGSGAGVDTVGDSSLLEEPPLLSGRTPPLSRSPTIRSAAGDRWGEALDDVDRLIDSRPSDSSGCESTTRCCSPQSRPRPSSTLGPLTWPTAAAAPAAAAAASDAVMPAYGLAEIGHVARQPPLQPEVRRTVDESGESRRLRRWRGAAHQDAAALAQALPNATGSAALAYGGASTRSSGYLPGSCEAQDGKKEEEDGCASPASTAPIPSERPQHPFGNQGMHSSTPMRSPGWLREYVEKARSERTPVPEPPRDGFALSLPAGAGGGGRGGFGSLRRGLGGRGAFGDGGGRFDTSAPPIGQWYTPSLVSGARE